MKGIGVDIVEFERILAIKNREKFVDKILNKKEIAVYATIINKQRRLEYLAGRFAVKEALYKADNLACAGQKFTDFAILNDSAGAPYLASPTGMTVKITISHSKNYAVAFVVVF